MNKNKGQTLLEYTLLIGVVMLIFFAMSPMIKRSAQGVIKTVADQIGEQVNADQAQYNQATLTYRDIFEDGGLDSQVATTKSLQNTRLLEDAGDMTYQHFDTVEIHSTTDMGLGHTEK